MIDQNCEQQQVTSAEVSAPAVFTGFLISNFCLERKACWREKTLSVLKIGTPSRFNHVAKLRMAAFDILLA
jgi:hypothetical protein